MESEAQAAAEASSAGWAALVEAMSAVEQAAAETEVATASLLAPAAAMLVGRADPAAMVVQEQSGARQTVDFATH